MTPSTRARRTTAVVRARLRLRHAEARHGAGSLEATQARVQLAQALEAAGLTPEKP